MFSVWSFQNGEMLHGCLRDTFLLTHKNSTYSLSPNCKGKKNKKKNKKKEKKKEEEEEEGKKKKKMKRG